MITRASTTADRTERERLLLIRCGMVVTFVGLALYHFDDHRLTDFLSSTMVFTGVLMALPQLVVQALNNSQTS